MKLSLFNFFICGSKPLDSRKVVGADRKDPNVNIKILPSVIKLLFIQQKDWMSPLESHIKIKFSVQKRQLFVLFSQKIYLKIFYFLMCQYQHFLTSLSPTKEKINKITGVSHYVASRGFGSAILSIKYFVYTKY